VSRRLHLPLAILFGVLVRVPFWAEALRTPVDGDTAIIGLMARHLGRGTTMWGQPYGSPLEAWLAAPFVAALGTTGEALRLFYFLMGLGLIPAAYGLGRALDPRAALPAAFLVACPPPYLLLLSALPPPMYPAALVLCGVLLLLAVRVGSRLAAGERPFGLLAGWGAAAGLALWTHLMAGAVVAASLVWLWRRAAGRRAALLAAVLPLLVVSAAWWVPALADAQAARVVGPSDRAQSTGDHLREVVPRLYVPLGGLLGTHVPLVADDADHVVLAPRWAAAALVLVYGIGLVRAAQASAGSAAARLFLAAAVLGLLLFPIPARSSSVSIRFLTPLYLPIAALVAWSPVARGRLRRSWIVVLALCGLHLAGATRLLAAWRAADRAAAPFLLPDLSPARRLLEAHGLRRAYASYGPAYRLTYETGERIVVSQPWNERFLHYPLPYLDEVRFATGVAWILTPAIPSDLPGPRAFEDQLAAAGGSWRRTDAGAASVYHSFIPPFSPSVEPAPGAGPAGDGDPGTALEPAPTDTVTLALPAAVPLDGVALVAGTTGPRLPRSMDVSVSADGAVFEVVARRRRRGEREDLRWVNGHPQYVLDHDLIAVALGGRTVAAVRISPVASTDPWAVGEVLLHRSDDPRRGLPWDEWLDPGLGWAERKRALVARPRRDREDWYYRLLLASRR
jgi:hypothetical protein